MSDEITKTENSDEISKSGVGEATSEVVNAAVDAPESYVHGVGPDGQGDIGGGNWATIPNWTDGHASGVHASGGVGRVNDGNATDYGNLGQSDRLNLGTPYNVEQQPLPDGSGAAPVNPSGQFGGGILNPVQGRQFIDYVWDSTVLAKDGRRITMRGNTMELEKVNVGQRVVRAAAQADGVYENAGAVFSKVDLSTKKLRLDYEISTEALEDNIEGAALEDHLVRLMTGAFANDIEDLAINGDLSAKRFQADGVTPGLDSDPFLAIMDGFCVQVDEGAHAAVPPYFAEAAATAGTGDLWQYAEGGAIHTDPAQKGDWERFINEGGAPKLMDNVGDGVARPVWGTETMQELILAMPRKYRAIKNGLRFYAGSDTFAKIVATNGTGTNTGAWPASYEYANAYLNGNAQEFGGPQATRVLGVPVLEVPYFPENRVELTFPQNRIWGIQRDITVNREYVAKKDTIEYTVFMRFGVAWEELDAVAYIQQ